MRDPDRIAKMLHLVYRIWKKWPDLRLMQLLTAPFKNGEDLFNLEEGDLYIKLQEFYGDKL